VTQNVDAEWQALVAKIGKSGVVVDAPPGSPPTCQRCRKPLEGEPKSVTDRYDEVTLWHHECWEAYSAEREERRKLARAAAIDEQVKQIERRFRYYLAGNITCDINERGFGVCQPPQWDFARFDHPEFRRRSSRKIVGAIEKWDPLKLPTLLLAAPTGSGKSAGVLAWLWRYRDQQIARARAGEENAGVTTFIWATGPELTVARRNASLGDEAPLIKHALDCGMLILDELGFERMSEVPFELVDHRYRRQAVTVVTTGLRSVEFRARYGDAMFRRLTENGALVEDFPVE
jgi:hypothetical protein